jgi:hypothetical protein
VPTQEQIREDGIACTTLADVARTPRYVLMTAAYNEAQNIEKTICSVLLQTVRPERWVIVSDNSTDDTDAIIQRYAAQHELIRFLRVNRTPGHSFRSKVIALKQGAALLQDVNYEFIGNLDADITLPATYFAVLMSKFEAKPSLGMLSGFVHEEAAGEFRSRKSNRTVSVPHAAQLVRRECYEAIGGYSVLKYGGEDWYAQTCARMQGWDAESISALPIFHHKPTGTGANLLAHRYRLGKLDYSFGSHPAFEVVKCIRHASDTPFVIGGMLRLLGFIGCCLRREPRAVSNDFMTFLRKEQLGRFSRQLNCVTLPQSKSGYPSQSN